MNYVHRFGFFQIHFFVECFSQACQYCYTFLFEQFSYFSNSIRLRLEVTKYTPPKIRNTATIFVKLKESIFQQTATIHATIGWI